MSSIRANVEKAIRDLALLSAIADPSDTTGVMALKELLSGLTKEVSAHSEFPELKAELSKLENSLESKDDNTLLKTVSLFCEQAQQYLEAPEHAAEIFSPDLISSAESDNIDPEFVTEFVSKHAVALDDFEGWLVDYRFSSETASDDEKAQFSSRVKGYLHTLKGDSGFVGLSGIARVTHLLESLIEQEGLDAWLRRLVDFKEWALEYCQCLTSGAEVKRSASSFIDSLAKSAGFESGEELEASLTVATSESGAAKSSEPEKPSKNSDQYDVSSEVELLAEFIAEALEHLQTVEAVLLESGSSPASDTIDQVFRAVHSLKGASAYFGLLEVNETSHLLENHYDSVRSKETSFSQLLFDLTLEYVDLQKSLLRAAKEAAASGSKIKRSSKVSEFLARLSQLTDATASSLSSVVETVSDEVPTDQVATQSASHTPSVLRTFVKVDTERLDRLVEAIGEMVIYTSMLVRTCREQMSGQEDIIRTTHQVEKFSRDLQDIGMSMRLEPIKGLFQKMSRLVWDISRKLGKDVRLQTEGEDTELDRNVIEKLADPLMHMVRNAIDHGLETAEEREKAGKSPSGTVTLTASHIGGSIQIVIADDGKGLDAERLREKAIERGIISEDKILSPAECFGLIFSPGFSTAKQVSDLSGRGVGMDVVRTNIESMQGQVRIDSELGRGTRFTIELPLTLAIVDGIEVLSGGSRFIIPTLSIVEIVHLKEKNGRISVLKGETLEFRGSFIPVLSVRSVLNISQSGGTIDSIAVVVEAGAARFALLVDSLEGSCQTVIKSLGSMFANEKGLAGCSIMANGDIGLILDIRSLWDLAHGKDAEAGEE